MSGFRERVASVELLIEQSRALVESARGLVGSGELEVLERALARELLMLLSDGAKDADFAVEHVAVAA